MRANNSFLWKALHAWFRNEQQSMPFVSHEVSREPGNGQHAPWKRRKPRPSKARGLRTSTGCLTCRRRRIKCDEARPRCENCGKSDRLCEYATQTISLRTEHASDSEERPSPPQRDIPEHQMTYAMNIPAANAATVQSVPVSVDNITIQAQELTNRARGVWPQHLIPRADEQGSYPCMQDSPDTGRSSLFDYDVSGTDSFGSFCTAPWDWYDLLAADAIQDLQKHRDLNGSFLPNFDATSLSRRHSPAPDDQGLKPADSNPNLVGVTQHSSNIFQSEPWNSTSRIVIQGNDLGYFQHYINVIGPILDLFDPENHFTVTVPHLALHNEGLLKSLLAVAARHKALTTANQDHDIQTSASSVASPLLYDQTEVATRYYYETLGYLSQTLFYPSYSRSLEILATAILISTYEMFDAHVSSNIDNWERHLQGAFWIQRSQDNDGESADGLRRAVWWAWLRQDTWAAFRAGRPAMTIWRPKKSLSQLSSDELATFIIYIAAKSVQFAASDKNHDILGHIERGKWLLKTLEEWKNSLPPSFEPIQSDRTSGTGSSMMLASNQTNVGHSVFSPVWIHPPQYAAAIQMYHFARLVVLLHETSTGGPAAYRRKEELLGESVDTICGIALAASSHSPPSMLVSLQAIFVAGLCTRTPERENALLSILIETLEISPFAPHALAEEWKTCWSGIH